jgi:hypothetical protein
MKNKLLLTLMLNSHFVNSPAAAQEDFPQAALDQIKDSVERQVGNAFVRFADQKAKSFRGDLILQFPDGNRVEQRIGALQGDSYSAIQFFNSFPTEFENRRYQFQISIAKSYGEDDQYIIYLDMQTAESSNEAPLTAKILIPSESIFLDRSQNILKDDIHIDVEFNNSNEARAKRLNGTKLKINLKALNPVVAFVPYFYSDLAELYNLLPFSPFAVDRSQGRIQFFRSWVGGSFSIKSAVTVWSYRDNSKCTDRKPRGFYNYECSQKFEYSALADVDSSQTDQAGPSKIFTRVLSATAQPEFCRCEHMGW